MSVLTNLRALWQARSTRERQALLVMAVVVAGAIAAQLLWLAWTQSPVLTTQLAQRRAELAHMQRGADSLAGLANTAAITPGATPPPVDSRAALVAAQLSSVPGNLAARPAGDGIVEIKGTTDFNALIGLLARLHTSHGLRVTALDASPAAGAGMVSAQVELAAQ